MTTQRSYRIRADGVVLWYPDPSTEHYIGIIVPSAPPRNWRWTSADSKASGTEASQITAIEHMIQHWLSTHSTGSTLPVGTTDPATEESP